MNGMVQTSSVNDGFQSLQAGAAAYPSKPDFRKHVFTVRMDDENEFSLKFRIPEWIMKEASVYVNDELLAKAPKGNVFVEVNRIWKNNDIVTVLLPIGIQFITLPDDEKMGAFRYGPEVLAGICEQERVLKLYDEDPTKELSIICGRQWGDFIVRFHTEYQDPGFEVMKLNEIGNEPYQIYFKVIKK